MLFLKRLIKAAMWAVGRILPTDGKKIVFMSYYGRGYSDNPKAIAEELLSEQTDAKMVWIVKDEKEAATLPKEIIPCKYNSCKMILELSTARIWVDNARKFACLKKRGQYYLQTWHGFPLKRIEKDAAENLSENYVNNAIRDSRQTDLLLSNSRTVTDILRRCYWYDGEIAEFGSPRNDVFINTDITVNKKIRDFYNLPEERKILLYAPTFRADHSLDAYKMDIKEIQAACAERFGGEWSVFVRLHPNVAQLSESLFAYDGADIVNATMYPDMQELLCGSDILITDYSSSMFDFALSGKPCFRFALDLEEYMKDRNFYFNFDEIPFPYARTNTELSDIIKNFDEGIYSENRNRFYDSIKLCEDGKASARCAAWIKERLK